MSTRDTFVIVGGGLAGARAASTLREEGFEGRVVLIGAEAEQPYERPPLSKDLLRGESDAAAARVHPKAFYAEHDVELRLGVTATAIDPGASTVALDDGEALRYDRLLLATGAEPRRLRLPGADLDGVGVLRTLDDAARIRAALTGGARLAVIGGGWIGCEVAASARQLGAEVTILEMAPLPLANVLGPELAAVYRDVHVEQGVQLLTDVQVEAIEGAGRAERVRLGDGRTIDADLVLVGVGVAPRVQLAQDAGLDVGNGIVVDEHLETSAPGIFAAGDVASVPHPVFGRLRVEHWAAALEQGPAAARNMLGRETPYDKVPYFFSDQYDVGMEYSGHAAGHDRLVFRGDRQAREFVAFWLRGDRLLAGMNVNVWDVADPIQALIGAGQPVDADALADPGTPLEALAPA